jgi:hypothetical protein
VVKVTVAMERKLQVGDRLADRHGREYPVGRILAVLRYSLRPVRLELRLGEVRRKQGQMDLAVDAARRGSGSSSLRRRI